MTRKEAIMRFQRMKKILSIPNSDAEATIEAIDMAIEALKVDTVRCGECLHMKAECGDEGTCFYWCKHWENATDSWGWCYYGERRKP